MRLSLRLHLGPRVSARRARLPDPHDYPARHLTLNFAGAAFPPRLPGPDAAGPLSAPRCQKRTPGRRFTLARGGPDIAHP